MLDDVLWEALRLRPEVIAQRSAYFEMYANSVTEAVTPDVHDLIEQARISDLGLDEPLTWLEPALELDDDGSPFVAEGPMLEHRSLRGLDQAVLADALREFGTARMMSDVPAGLSVLYDAGLGYIRADVPFGWFLCALRSFGEAPMHALSILRVAWASHPSAEPDAAERDADRLPPRLLPVQEAARVPQQLLSLLLAVGQDGEAAEAGEPLFARLGEHPLTRSSVAVGATGRPFSEWWALLRAVDAGDGGAVHDGLRAFATEHGRQLAQAQRTSQWRGGRSAVELVDLEIAGGVCLAVRRQRAASEPALTADDFADLPPLARVSVAIGLAMADADSGPEPVAPSPGGYLDPSGGSDLAIDLGDDQALRSSTSLIRGGGEWALSFGSRAAAAVRRYIRPGGSFMGRRMQVKRQRFRRRATARFAPRAIWSRLRKP